MTKKRLWDYGKIAPHFGAYPVPEEFSFWYELVGTLEKDLLNYKPSTEIEPMGWTQFGEILTAALRASNASMQDLPYHNFLRTLELVESAKVLLDRYEELTQVEVSDGIKQAFLFGIAFQDCGYPGFFARSQAPNAEMLFRPELGVQCTNEFASMVEADEQAKRLGFNPAARLFISYVIASTTFGGAIKPVDLFGTMAQLIDLRPKSTFVAATSGQFAVLVGEGPVSERPDAEALISNRYEFLEFIKSCMDKMDAVAGVNLTPKEWRKDIQMFVDATRSIGDASMEGAVHFALTNSIHDHFQNV